MSEARKLRGLSGKSVAVFAKRKFLAWMSWGQLSQHERGSSRMRCSF